MKNLFVDCSNGISGDMLLSALVDSGVPKNILKSNVSCLGLRSNFELSFQEGKSHGLRGLRSYVINSECEGFSSKWKDIKSLLENASLNERVKEKALIVFNILAEAESSIHGDSLDSVQFHEVGSLDSVIDVLSVCVAIDFLGPNNIFFSNPPAGFGNVSTSHGFLPLPVPTVLYISQRFQIPLSFTHSSKEGELTTPTGMALIAAFSNCPKRPSLLDVNNIGIGLGHNDIGKPNFLRVFEFGRLLDHNCKEDIPSDNFQQRIVCQEAWIDDSSPEDIVLFADKLRDEGAIEVACQSIQMKKGRQGFSIKSIVLPENARKLRVVWFSHGTTLGFREWEENRWVLRRRIGKCFTSLGEIIFKQIEYPDGQLRIKPEHDELIRLTINTGKSLYEIRKLINLEQLDFIPSEDWSC